MFSFIIEVEGEVEWVKIAVNLINSQHLNTEFLKSGHLQYASRSLAVQMSICYSSQEQLKLICSVTEWAKQSNERAIRGTPCHPYLLLVPGVE